MNFINNINCWSCLQRICALLLMFCSLVNLNGCGFSQYPPLKKDLFSWQIPKNNVDVVKALIIKNGYTKLTEDNYHYEGAIVTQFGKKIWVSNTQNTVSITLSFKERDTNTQYYSNLGIRIASFDANYFPETINEIDSIEQIIYSKLIEVCGENNIIRGERKAKSSDSKWRFGPQR